MHVVSVDDILAEHGFAPPKIRALLPDQSTYKALLLQPKGIITANPSGVRNSDQGLATDQYSAFLDTAIQVEADLVVTPEYSVPWRVLEKRIENDDLPVEGGLWVLGCESITVEALSEMEERLSDKAHFIYERPGTEDPRFLNPVAYIFSTTHLEGPAETQKIILIQFKTCPMGDNQNFEVNSLLRGSRLYRFGGTGAQIRLITLICSDAFEFSEAHAYQLYDRTLIIHIQLNANPRQHQFRQYRTHLFQYGGDQTEVITLNWARDIRADLGAGERSWNNIAGSGWYLRPDRFDTGDNMLHHNHQHGLYYTWLAPDKCHSLFFSYDPAVFLVVATKVAHLGVMASLSRRIGPRMEALYTWDSDVGRWEIAGQANDKFSEISADAGLAASALTTMAESHPIAVERILALCAGLSITSANWYEVTKLDSCAIDSSEIIKRLTFCHDTESSAASFRRARMRAYQRTIRFVHEFRPPALSDFDGIFQFDWNRDSPHNNLISPRGGGGP